MIYLGQEMEPATVELLKMVIEPEDDRPEMVGSGTGKRLARHDAHTRGLIALDLLCIISGLYWSYSEAVKELEELKRERG